MGAVVVGVRPSLLPNPICSQRVNLRPVSINIFARYQRNGYESVPENRLIIPEEVVAVVEAEVVAERQKAVETWAAESKPEGNLAAFGPRICISTEACPHPAVFLSKALSLREVKQLPKLRQLSAENQNNHPLRDTRREKGWQAFDFIGNFEWSVSRLERTDGRRTNRLGMLQRITVGECLQSLMELT